MHDPRAVPSIWKVFVLGGPADQERAVRLLAQIDAARGLAGPGVAGGYGLDRAAYAGTRLMHS